MRLPDIHGPACRRPRAPISARSPSSATEKPNKSVRHRRVVEGLQQRAGGGVEEMRLPDIAALRVVVFSRRSAPGRRRARRTSRTNRCPSPSGRRRSAAARRWWRRTDAPARHWCPACRRARRSARGRRRARRTEAEPVAIVTVGSSKVCSSAPVSASKRCACPTSCPACRRFGRADQHPVAVERDGLSRTGREPSPSGRRRSAAARRWLRRTDAPARQRALRVVAGRADQHPVAGERDGGAELSPPSPSGRRRSAAARRCGVEEMRLPDIGCPACRRRARRSAPGRRRARRTAEPVADPSLSGRRRSAAARRWWRRTDAPARHCCPACVRRADQHPIAGERDGAAEIVAAVTVGSSKVCSSTGSPVPAGARFASMKSVGSAQSAGAPPGCSRRRRWAACRSA